MPKNLCCLAGIVAATVLMRVPAMADDPAAPGNIRGTTRNPSGQAVPAVEVVVHSVGEKTERSVICGSDGSFVVENLKPGKYELVAKADGFVSPSQVVDVAPGESARVNVALAVAGTPTSAANKAVQDSFFRRFAKAYADDWHNRTPSGPDAPYRGDPAPESNPPYPFTMWPYGGSPVIGQPNASPPPLMQALYNGPNGDAWKASGVQIYGWANTGFNVSTSNYGKFANAPAAYNQIANSIQLDQLTLYAERVPDTVQTDHFDWGFRFTALYGMDYRFTTQKGIFSDQLLGNNNTYGFDPVMAYIDLYFPQSSRGAEHQDWPLHIAPRHRSAVGAE